MTSKPIILPINSGSDGDARRWPKHSMVRNDEYFLERVAGLWAKDLDKITANASYRLDRLPTGYAGFEKGRKNDSTHIDRYVYGHANGRFRSLNEFYPHFKHLMENGNAIDCQCQHCLGYSDQPKMTARTSGKQIERSRHATGLSPVRQSRYFAQPVIPISQPKPRQPGQTTVQDLPHGRQESDPPSPQRRKQVDIEGTPDIYRALLDNLKDVGPGSSINEQIEEHMSPDWRAGHTMLMEMLKEWQSLPLYVPRQGELVLFVRNLSAGETLSWDFAAQTFRVLDLTSMSWIDRPKWEAGVVTQMPTERIEDADLAQTPSTKLTNVTLSGFRVEPMSQPAGMNKSYTKQHKYLPLHAIRPLALWKECLNNLDERQWHPTIRHALTATSTFSIIGSHHFKGQWPEATVYAKGVYIGPELIMIGDTVRLHPHPQEQRTQSVTDVLVVTGIRLRLVNLDEANDDDYDDTPAYNTCLHVSGRALTLDPSRSFDGIGKVPVSSDYALLSHGIRELGQWYHMIDPKKSKARVEVPFTRVIGRCYEDVALNTWFKPPSNLSPTSALQAGHEVQPTIITTSADFNTGVSRGLHGILEARQFSRKNDPRIDVTNEKAWYWGESRVQQLDLYEVNGRSVGVKDERRREQMNDWRKALRAMDGGKRGLEEYQAARKQRKEDQARKEREIAGSVSGQLAGSTNLESTTEADQAEESNGYATDVDDGKQMSKPGPSDIDLEDDDDADDAEDVLAKFKAPLASKGGLFTLRESGSDDGMTGLDNRL